MTWSLLFWALELAPSSLQIEIVTALHNYSCLTAPMHFTHLVLRSPYFVEIFQLAVKGWALELTAELFLLAALSLHLINSASLKSYTGHP